VFNPVVRTKLDAVHETSSKAMKWDLNTLYQMDDGELMGVLREMQAESEAAPEPGAEDEATDYVRAKIATVRRNVRQFQARHPGETEGAPDGAGEQPGA
jgi:D-mannonate dehydratase